MLYLNVKADKNHREINIDDNVVMVVDDGRKMIFAKEHDETVENFLKNVIFYMFKK